jgi:hypothetical protein
MVETAQQEKTVMDCVREDTAQMEQLQKDLDLLIGHEFKSPVTFYYRGHSFNLKLQRKLPK